MCPYQVEAVRFGIACSGRLLCADDMGLGKTLTALALTYEYREELGEKPKTTEAYKHISQERKSHNTQKYQEELGQDRVPPQVDSASTIQYYYSSYYYYYYYYYY